MTLLKRYPHLPPALPAGHNHSPLVYPDPKILSGDKESIAMATELPPENTIYPHSLAHGYPPRQLHTAMADHRIVVKELPCPGKEDCDPLPGYLLCM